MTTTRASVKHNAKSQVPIATGDLVERKRLSERFDALMEPGEGTRVLAVCAPAGFGKTTAVSAWARGLDRRRVRVAWCSLDATDSHTFRFWSTVLRSVTVAQPQLAQVGLAAPHRAGDGGFLSELVAALADRSLVLVLENLHEIIDLKLLADLDQFVGMLPASVKLVLTSRSDPPLTSLQGLQLRGQLGQLRVADLAFTRDELVRLAPELDEDRQLLIWERTEGWPALVQLMLLSMRTRLDVPLTPFEDDYVLAEYLFRELLRRQDSRVQSLMLVAGVPELLPLDLAVQLSGMTDAGRILDELVGASGLVTRAPAPSEDQPWYRFHPLLRSYLRAELARSDRQHEQQAHALASTWFLEAGFPLDAVHHATASEDLVVLEGVLAAAGLGLVNAGESSLLLDVLAGSTAWTRSPAPWTRVVTAAAQADLGRVAEARGELALAGPLADGEIGSDLGQAWHAVDLRVQRRRGMPIPLRSREEIPASSSPDVQIYAGVQLGGALLSVGQPSEAADALQIASELAYGLGRPAAVLDALVLLAMTKAASSDFRAVGPFLDRAFGIAEENGWGASPRLVNAHMLRAWCARLRIQDDVARRHVSRALALLDATTDPSVVVSVQILAEVMAFEADPRAFDSADRVHQVWKIVEGRRIPTLVVHTALVDVRFSLVLHRIDRVNETLAAVRRTVGECGELEVISAMLEAANGRRRQALDLVRPVTAGKIDVVSPMSRLVASALETRLALLEGDTFAATKTARQSLELAMTYDAPRAIMDFGGEEMLNLLGLERGRWGPHELLAEQITGTKRTPDPPAEVLTTRELEVLVELPTMRTVDEIAQSMYVSSNTLKTHLRSVYRKLGVSSRRDAITAARQRGLL